MTTAAGLIAVVRGNRRCTAELQAAAVRVWAEQRGSAIVSTSGAGVDALGKALDSIVQGQAEGLVVANLAVLGSVAEQEAVRTELQRVGGALHVLDPTGGASDGPARELIRDYEDARATLAGKVAAAKLHRGRQATREAGGRIGGRSPFGYRAVAGALVRDAREQAVITRARELKEQYGLGTTEIARQLQTEGYKKRDGSSDWSASFVHRILVRESA